MNINRSARIIAALGCAVVFSMPVIAAGVTPDKATMPQLPTYTIPATATLRLIPPGASHSITPSSTYYGIGPNGAVSTGAVSPGDVIVFSAGTHQGPQFSGFTSPTASAPIMVTNDGSNLRASAQWRAAKAALGVEPGPAGWARRGWQGDVLRHVGEIRQDGEPHQLAEYSFRWSRATPPPTMVSISSAADAWADTTPR